MKKILFSIFIIFFLQVNVFAYSKNIIPGGESIGINIDSDGLIVVGFYKVNNEYIGKNTIKIGDRIIKINNKVVESLDDISNVLDEELDDIGYASVELIRNHDVINTTLNIQKEDEVYKTGLYVKDNITGIGTLTYIDPISKIYGALGHEIILSETKNKVEIKNGNILMSRVSSINKSRNGTVGSKNANISYDKILGNIKKNTNKGIFGDYSAILPKKELLEVASYSSIELGDAYILTVLNNSNINKYKINILDKYNNKKDTQKAFSFEITDKKLLNATGGVVQGMSGSPIVQGDKIIGAVTNVVVDNVKIGYGISIITMLKEGES